MLPMDAGHVLVHRLDLVLHGHCKGVQAVALVYRSRVASERR